MEDGTVWWYMSEYYYVKKYAGKSKKLLQADGLKLATGKQFKQTYSNKYRPYTNTMDYLDDALNNRHQKLIGILGWSWNFGCIKIFLEVSNLSYFYFSPWVGHLGSVYNIFVGLKKNLNSKMVTDHCWHEIDDKKLYKAECKNLYGNFKDEIPINRPSEWGIHVKISIFGDYKHTGNLSTCSFHNGLFFFIKSYFINWYSKGQVDV